MSALAAAVQAAEQQPRLGLDDVATASLWPEELGAPLTYGQAAEKLVAAPPPEQLAADGDAVGRGPLMPVERSASFASDSGGSSAPSYESGADSGADDTGSPRFRFAEPRPASPVPHPASAAHPSPPADIPQIRTRAGLQQRSPGQGHPPPTGRPARHCSTQLTHAQHARRPARSSVCSPAPVPRLCCRLWGGRQPGLPQLRGPLAGGQPKARWALRLLGIPGHRGGAAPVSNRADGSRAGLARRVPAPVDAPASGGAQPLGSRGSG